MPSEYEVLVVDDDAMQAGAVAEVLSALGYSCRVLPDGTRVMDEARRAQPRLIILDIIMPGTDGLALCMKLKPEVAAWGGRLVVASGKDRSVEEPRAKKAGAELFLEKPYQLRTIKATLTQLLGAPRPPEKAPAESKVAIKLWGSRGPGAPPAGSAYGIRTACVSVGLPTGEVFILDAGTGLVDCGHALLKSGTASATLLLTHYHPDHLAGLKDCALLKRQGFELRIAGPLDVDTNLSELCRGLQATAKLSSFLVEEREYRFNDRVLMSSTFTNHPTTTLAYSLSIDGKKLVYCADAELPAADEVDVGNNFERLRHFAAAADLLLLDAACLPEDRQAPWAKGHSSWREAVRLAVEAGARRLCLFHAALGYPDAALAKAEAAAQEAAAGQSSSLACFLAKDGGVLLL